MTIPVSIVGASGYTGGELVRLLARHPGVHVAHVTSERYAGSPLAAVFPHLAAVSAGSGLVCQSLADFQRGDPGPFVFTALPHLSAMEAIPGLLARGARVVDLSADFRLRDAGVYARWYGTRHLAPALLAEAVYGLPERYRQAVGRARLVANPGCYPTSVLLALAPLLSAGLLDPDTILIDSKSGVSGAGRSPAQGTLFADLDGGFQAYKVEGHRHRPEMEQELSRVAGRSLVVRFVPHLLPQSRGILSTCHLRPADGKVDASRWRSVLAACYRDEPFVHLLPAGQWPATSHVRGSNVCHLAVGADEESGWMTVVSVIDNLVKGAAGQAVQNMNLMLGLEENTGLEQLPLFP